MPTPEQHALLGASSAHIWSKCTAMPRATEHIEDKGSIYAAEGTLAHALGELKLRKQFVEPMGMRAFHTRENKLKKVEPQDENGAVRDPSTYWAEMEECTDQYLDKVKELALARKEKPFVALEQRLDYSAWAPEGYGTGDCVLIGEGWLDIVDYKHGKGQFVKVTDNIQLKLYALGAIKMFDMLYDIQHVRLTICQPRKNNIASWETTKADLLAWAETIAPIAQAAFYGLGAFVPGEHCQFCRLNGSCKAQAESAFSVIEKAAAPTAGMHLPTPPVNPVMSDAEVAHYLDELRMLNVAGWIKKLESYATTRILEGNDVPGYKLVEGRTSRIFSDAAKVKEQWLAAGFSEATLSDIVPKSVTQLEESMGKKVVADTLGDLIAKTAGKPTLAPTTDPRKPYQQASVEDDFGTPPPPAPASGQAI